MISERKIKKIKERLTEIVGNEHVSSSPDLLESYAKDISFTPAMQPELIVRPVNVSEIQRIVQWANETLTPLIPVSSGPPRFYGDTIPGVSGTVILDLVRMQRILRIDRRNRMIVIEPGVTFSRLQPELAKAGLRISTPLLPRSNKSVIASLLERQPTLVPKYNWSLPEPLRCLEIVLGRGEILWTGEAGAGTHSLEKQWERGLAQIDPKGPQETDWYRLVSGAQGSLGIVTWASIKCELLPKVHKLFFIPADSLDDLIDCAYRLLRLRLGDEFLILNNSTLSAILTRETSEIEIPHEKMPPWVILIGVAGRDILPEERVDVQEQDIRETCQQFGLHIMTSVSEIEGKEVLASLLNPSGELYWKVKHKGGCQDIFFLTTLDRTPGFVDMVYSLAESIECPLSDIGVYIQSQHQGVSHHCEFTIYYDPTDPYEVTRAKKLYNLASAELMKKGAFFSRPYGEWADMCYNRDPKSAVLLKYLKQILDPHNILNPGKLCFTVDNNKYI